MYERIHLLNGTIAIESKPNLGTRIRALVPVAMQPISLPRVRLKSERTGERYGTRKNSACG